MTTNPTPTQQGETLEPEPVLLDRNDVLDAVALFCSHFELLGERFKKQLRNAIRAIPPARRAAVAEPRGDVDKVLNMVWAAEAGVAIYVYQAEREDRRMIEIRKGDQVVAAATVEKHNRDNLAESISTGDLRYAPEEVATLVRAATSSPAPAESDDYVAWCCYTCDESGCIQTIKTCDSDTKGAFRVYRHPATVVTAPAESTRVAGEQNTMEAWLKEIESACNAALLDIYDLSIANAPIPAKDCREIADYVGHRVGQIRRAIAAIRSTGPSDSARQAAEEIVRAVEGGEPPLETHVNRVMEIISKHFAAAPPPLFTEGNREEAIKLLRQLREISDPEEIARQKESWAQLEAASHPDPADQWRQGMRDAAKEVCDACDNETRYGPARKIEGSTRWWHGDNNIPCEAGGIWHALAERATSAAAPEVVVVTNNHKIRTRSLRLRSAISSPFLSVGGGFNCFVCLFDS